MPFDVGADDYVGSVDDGGDDDDDNNGIDDDDDDIYMGLNKSEGTRLFPSNDPFAFPCTHLMALAHATIFH